jgi:hypothetical protein
MKIKEVKVKAPRFGSIISMVQFLGHEIGNDSQLFCDEPNRKPRRVAFDPKECEVRRRINSR